MLRQRWDKPRGTWKDLQIRRDVVVTDGIRYRLYSHVKATFEGVAYANLHRLKAACDEICSRDLVGLR